MQEPIALLPYNLTELKTFISECVAIGIATASADVKPAPEMDGYLSRRQAADTLHVSLQTLNEKTKAGEIVAYRFGARVLYKKADLEAALISTDRYRRTGNKPGPKPKIKAAA